MKPYGSMEFNTQNKKRSILALISLVFLFLLSFNGASIFSVKIPSLASSSSATTTATHHHSPAAKPRNLISISSSSIHHAPKEEEEEVEENQSTISIPHLKLQSTDHSGKNPPPPPPSAATVSAVAGDHNTFVPPVPSFRYHHQKQMAPPNPNSNPNPNSKEAKQEVVSNTHLPAPLHKSEDLSSSSPMRNKKILKTLAVLGSSSRGRRRDEFPTRVKEHFAKRSSNETDVVSSCKVRFFMTWIAPLKAFTERAFHSIESIFKTHPNDGCVLIVSSSLDSIKGRRILKPFTDNGFRVAAIAPDFGYLFKNTMAESWFSRLVQGNVRPGDIPLGQNISNLLRLCLLYKYGGVYVDTDVIVLKSFAKLKNSIGAQTVDPSSKNWSRLNNAVMVFDKMHPLLYKFIEEFALTFNGNKWGHNGPYMVSRVVSRVEGRPGFNFTVLPPMAFYPVNWDKVRVLFRGAKNESDARYLKGKYEVIRNQSYSVHLWNKQSRVFHIEDGSILKRILADKCIFCGSSSKEYITDTIG